LPTLDSIKITGRADWRHIVAAGGPIVCVIAPKV
jgi:hypothetical protein